MKVIVLGSASAVASETRRNTHLLVCGTHEAILLDCGVSPSSRIRAHGIDPQHIVAIALTHFHPDHVSGLASFIMDEWLLGRQQTLRILAGTHALRRARALLDLFDWAEWKGMYPLEFVPLPEAAGLAFEGRELILRSAPVDHLIPASAFRVESRDSRHALAFSGDTQSGRALEDLARGVDLLVHEAAGRAPGHSSPEEAGQAATRANVRGLMLIHFDPSVDAQILIERARTTFAGPIRAAEDDLEIEF